MTEMKKNKNKSAQPYLEPVGDVQSSAFYIQSPLIKNKVEKDRAVCRNKSFLC